MAGLNGLLLSKSRDSAQNRTRIPPFQLHVMSDII